MTRTVIENSMIFQNDTFISDHVIIIEDEKIASIIPHADLTHYQGDTRVDARRSYALPGFVDVHIHGSNGFDTMDATQESLQGLCDYLVTQGITSVLPTTMSDSNQRITDALNALEQFASYKHTPYIGVHLEGPYLNSNHRGSQPDTHLRTPQRNEYLKWFESGQIKLITIAPELDNGDLLIQDARDHNISVSLGHSGATYDQAHHAFEAGLSQITHTFNGMVGIHHRQPGAFVAASENPNITFQIIPDGTHVHPAVINMLVKLVGTERVVVITDAMRAAGLADGNYQLGDVDVTVTNGEARTRAGGLAGSTLTMPNALRNMMRFCDLSLAEVVPMLTRVPAQSIGMYPQKGSLNIGIDADIVLWNADIGVQATFIGGKSVYQREIVS
jgi:N-acetylglucosamine-6-phosphate deacetylase